MFPRKYASTLMYTDLANMCASSCTVGAFGA